MSVSAAIQEVQAVNHSKEETEPQYTTRLVRFVSRCKNEYCNDEVITMNIKELLSALST